MSAYVDQFQLFNGQGSLPITVLSTTNSEENTLPFGDLMEVSYKGKLLFLTWSTYYSHYEGIINNMKGFVY